MEHNQLTNIRQLCNRLERATSTGERIEALYELQVHI